jgi:hypothetical protein
VPIAPGHTALTRMPAAAYSSAAVRVSWITPPHDYPVRSVWALSYGWREWPALKTWLQGTHRGVAPEHLQSYLDEFVFRHNRRRTPLAAFQTLLGLGAIHEPTTYRQIVQTERTG